MIASQLPGLAMTLDDFMDLSVFELEVLYRESLRLKIEKEKSLQLACMIPHMKHTDRRRVVQIQEEAYKIASSGKTYQETQEDMWRQIHEQVDD